MSKSDTKDTKNIQDAPKPKEKEKPSSGWGSDSKGRPNSGGWGSEK